MSAWRRVISRKLQVKESLRGMEEFIRYRSICRFEMKLEPENSSQIGFFLITDELKRMDSSATA